MHEFCGKLKNLELELKVDEVIKRINKSRSYSNAYKEFIKRTGNFVSDKDRESIWILFDYADDGIGPGFEFVTDDEIRRDYDIMLHKIVLGRF